MSTVEVSTKETNPFLVKKIKNNLQELANLDNDVLLKLAIISKNEKALAMFIENYELLKNM